MPADAGRPRRSVGLLGKLFGSCIKSPVGVPLPVEIPRAIRDAFAHVPLGLLQRALAEATTSRTALKKISQEADWASQFDRQAQGALAGRRFGEFMALVNADVARVSQITQLGPADAAELLRLGASSGGALPSNSHRALMVMLLYGAREKAQAEETLAPALQTCEATRSIPLTDAWKLCLDRKAWVGRAEHGGLRFENEPGYMAAMYRALTVVLTSQAPLDAGSLEHLHDTAVAGVFTKKAMREGLAECSDEKLAAVIDLTAPGALESRSRSLPLVDGMQLISRGFRRLVTDAEGRSKYEATGFKLIAGQNRTTEGLRQLALRRGAGFTVFHPETKERLTRENYRDFSHLRELEVMTLPSTREHCIFEANEHLDDCRKAVANVGSDDTKILAIARCCQALEQAHLFMDGNARTLGFLVVNKLLIENGLPLTVLDDPNCLDGFSMTEIAENIRRGQRTFESLASEAAFTN